jgi:mannose-6-phosphate isomerase-like protein (cupin superfamily)
VQLAGSNDSVQTPHKCENIGSERLDIIRIHSSSRFIQENLE